MGTDLQTRGLDKLEQINNNLDEGNLLIDGVNKEVGRQRDLLNRADLEVLEIDSTLKRTNRYLIYFSQEYTSDKFIRIMVILILLAVVAIILTVIIKKNQT
jgi:hypothetical protein